jgi:hypothetical protein
MGRRGPLPRPAFGSSPNLQVGARLPRRLPSECRPAAQQRAPAAGPGPGGGREAGASRRWRGVARDGAENVL